MLNSASDSVSVINTDTLTKSADDIQVGKYPGHAILSDDGRWLFVLNKFSNSVSAINTATLTKEPNDIQVGGEPYAAVIFKPSTNEYVKSIQDLAVEIKNSPQSAFNLDSLVSALQELRQNISKVPVTKRKEVLEDVGILLQYLQAAHKNSELLMPLNIFFSGAAETLILPPHQDMYSNATFQHAYQNLDKIYDDYRHHNKTVPLASIQEQIKQALGTDRAEYPDIYRSA